MLEQVAGLVVAGAATATATLVVTRSSLFGPLRSRITPELLHELITCPFCFSIWTSAIITLLFPVVTLQPVFLFNFIVQWLATAGIAAPFMQIIFKAIEALQV